MSKPRQETSAADFLPPRLTLPALAAAARSCHGCDLWKRGTQTVFGDGPRHAEVMLVGEQPGNDEDLAGAPFVGPAGRLLDRALAAAGIDRSRVYVTNAVKHFKWVPRGKRRIHEKPNAREIAACMPWLDAELAVVAPRAVVCLGATAAQALLGRSFRVTRDRGKLLPSERAELVMATIHPSADADAKASAPRAPDDHARHVELAHLIADLRVLARALGEHAAAPAP